MGRVWQEGKGVEGKKRGGAGKKEHGIEAVGKHARLTKRDF